MYIDILILKILGFILFCCIIIVLILFSKRTINKNKKIKSFTYLKNILNDYDEPFIITYRYKKFEDYSEILKECTNQNLVFKKEMENIKSKEKLEYEKMIGKQKSIKKYLQMIEDYFKIKIVDGKTKNSLFY